MTPPGDLRKWPSFKNEHRTDGTGPYLIVAATLGECIREFMARPAATRHLYEIQNGIPTLWVRAVCNLYSITTNQEAIILLFRVINRYVGSLPPMPGVFFRLPCPRRAQCWCRARADHDALGNAAAAQAWRAARH